jgi:predicted ABC-type ATPase
MAPPTFYVLAGPNGSGKTSFALNDPGLKDITFINADIEAERLSPGSPAKAALAAGRVTFAKIAHEISEGNEFALETTLSGLSTLETMRRALAAGYRIDFTYVCLSSPKLNVARVGKRVLAGGHHVPDKDVERRYCRSLENLPTASVLAERVRVFDNSTGSAPELLLERRERSLLILRQELPGWFKIAFQIDSTAVDPTEHVERRFRELEQPSR